MFGETPAGTWVVTRNAVEALAAAPAPCKRWLLHQRIQAVLHQSTWIAILWAAHVSVAIRSTSHWSCLALPQHRAKNTSLVALQTVLLLQAPL